LISKDDKKRTSNMTSHHQNNLLSRRTLLKTMMGVGAAGTSCMTALVANAANTANTRTRIDVHSHLIPDFYKQAMDNYGEKGDGGIATPSWSISSALKFMDKFGIAVQVVSLSEPGFAFLPDRAARVSMGKKINEYIRDELIHAPVGSAHYRRFGGFAAIPLANTNDPAEVASASAEAIRAIQILGLDGIGLFTNYNGVYLGDPKLEPLMRALNDLGAYVCIHPVAPPVASTLSMPAFVLDFPFETTRAVANMFYKGIFQRYPNIRWQLPHAGGTIPYLSYRSGLAVGNTNPNQSPYANLFFDTALSAAPAAMSAVRKITDVSHVLLGTDFPYSGITYSLKLAGDPNAELNESFNPNERKQVDRTNALAQLPRLAARLA
jgi:6-methylsalicylate decarboxylase